MAGVEELRKILERVWGYDSFRPLQAEAMRPSRSTSSVEAVRRQSDASAGATATLGPWVGLVWQAGASSSRPIISQSRGMAIILRSCRKRALRGFRNPVRSG